MFGKTVVAVVAIAMTINMFCNFVLEYISIHFKFLMPLHWHIQYSSVQKHSNLSFKIVAFKVQISEFLHLLFVFEVY